MSKTTTYGLISDIHNDPRVIKQAIEALKEEGAEKLILNGDIGIRSEELQASQEYTATILHHAAQSGLETYVQPGSHETVGAYKPVIEHFAQRASNIIDVMQHPVIDNNDHRLVFIPGRDWGPGGEYLFANGKVPTGDYFRNIHNELIPFPQSKEEEQELQRLSEIGKLAGLVHYKNINDIVDQVQDPERTILVCHVPRRFDNVNTGVDMAEFGEITKPFYADFIQYADGDEDIKIGDKPFAASTIIKPKKVVNYVRNQQFDEDGIFPGPTAKKFIAAGAPVQLKKENRGNTDLATLYDKLSIVKAVSGHFHESSHRAHDKAGTPVEENFFVNELFYNSGQLDLGYCGTISVADDKIAYENVKIKF